MNREGLDKIKQLRDDCEHAADFYVEKPGLAASANTVIDLYRTIARLAAIIQNFDK